jgi:hypothetical protein
MLGNTLHLSHTPNPPPLFLSGKIFKNRVIIEKNRKAYLITIHLEMHRPA